MVNNFKDLIAWQKSIVLVDDIYTVTKNFPKDEIFGLTQQIRRAAVSIASNIAEGSSKKSTPEFLRFLNISYGSLAEVETQVIIAKNQKYILEIENITEKISELRKILSGLINSLKKKTEL